MEINDSRPFSVEHVGTSTWVFRLNIPRRLGLLIVMAALAILAVIVVQAVSMRQTLFDERVVAVHNEVQTATSLVRGLAAEAAAGQMSDAEAKERAVSALHAMRFGNDDYFFVFLYDGTCVVSGLRQVEGTNLIEAKDSKGVRFIYGLIAAARSGGGFVSYLYPRVGQSRPSPKISYAMAVEPWGWAVGAGVYIDDIDQIFRQRVLEMMLWGGGFMVVLGVGAWLIARSVVHPVRGMTSTMVELAAGNTTTEVPSLERGDEVGDMARSVEVFKNKILEADRLRSEQETERVRAAAERKAEMLRFAQNFEDKVGGIVSIVASSATEMEAAAQSMIATAGEATHGATIVAAAATQASANVQTVAAASEELSASIGEIGRQMEQSSNFVREAVAQAGRTNGTVDGLSSAAQKIGEIVGLIQDIARHTNLLALNATIEAARAGEQGKGFAVVASEVKTLANQTAKATEEIVAQVQAIRDATGGAVNEIQSIGATIGQINEVDSAIAAAIQEQGAATSEIANNVNQAAQGTQEVSANIVGVSDASRAVGDAALQLRDTASELAQKSDLLKREVADFLAMVRAA
jgi:methyl-accepting chemotaxis protein